MQSKILKIDKTLIILSGLAIIGLAFYYWNIALPNGNLGTKDYDPFYDYNSNKGIVLINTINLVLCLSISIIGIIWIRKNQINYRWIYAIFTLCLLTALNRWIELWYGSTFYYGEIRDKQGLGFPWLSLLLIFYIIWRFHFELDTKKRIIIKAIISILTTGILYGFYRMIYEKWNLWQS